MTNTVKKSLLIIYLTISWPSIEKFYEIVEKLSSYVDIFEFGIPTKNPKYDGPTIKLTHKFAKIYGLNSLKLLENLSIKNKILLTYFEDYLIENKVEVLFKEVSNLNFISILLPDLLFDYPEYLNYYVNLCQEYSLKPSFFISSKFPHHLIRKLLNYEPYLIYLGLQAATGIELPIYVTRNIRIYRELINSSETLFVIGFAISRIEQILKFLELKVDGIVIGSKIVKLVSDYGVEKAIEFVREIREVISRTIVKS